MTPTINRLPIILILIVTLSSCYKKDSKLISNEDQFLSNAKAYFNKHISLPSTAQLGNIDSKNPRKDLPKNPDWNKAKRIKFSGEDAIIVPVVYEQPFVILSNFSGNAAYSVNDITKLLIYKDKYNQYQFELLTYFPDKNYKKDKFSGFLFVENWQGELLNEFWYEPGRTTKKLDIGKQRIANQISSGDIRPNAIVTICFEISGYNYSPSEGTYYYWSYPAGCNSYFFNDAPSGGNSGDEHLDPLGSSGGGGGDGGFTPVDFVVVEDGPDKIANVADYNKCFTNSPGNGSQFKVKICVEQPIPGTREAWGFNGSNASGSINPVMVGHTFLVLTQETANGTITRNVGYYPASGVHNFSPSANGELNNDANTGYDIAIEISMTSSQFFNILDFIAQTNNPGFLYNLNTNNCTHFALNALGAAGINLPRTSGSWTNGGGLNPGDLGEDLRSMTLNPNMTRSTVNNYHPNTGTCY